MGYFTTEVDVLALPSGAEHQVTIKRRVKGGDHSEALRACLDHEGTDASRFQIYAKALMPLAIVSWNLTDEAGAPVPVTAESVANLEREDFEFLRDEIVNRASTRPEKDEAPFVSGSGQRSRAMTSRSRKS